MIKKTTIVFILALWSSFASLKAQVINFPDENFLEYILLYTKIDTNRDGEIQVSEAEAYTDGFTIPDKITNLTGIEYFKNITSLTLNATKVTQLNISNNTQLQRLYVYKTLLQKIDISANINLFLVDVKENSFLTDFTVGKNSQLQLLSLMFNNIAAIDVTNCPKLTNFYLASNNLSSIDITKNPRLAEFNVASNHLSTLDLSNNSRLTYLNIGLNKISQLDISNNNLLDTFMIQGNPISKIDVSKTKYLRQFVIDNTAIDSIDLTPLTMLQYFYANYSHLKTIDASKNPNLIYINAVENKNMTFINFKNGFNKNAVGFFATKSPNLKCIQVDDVSYSSSQQLWQKDTSAQYATDCSSVMSSNEVNTKSKVTAYPNPTKDYVQLSNMAEEATVYNMLGQQIAGYKKVQMIDLSHLSAGNYILKVTDIHGTTSSIKIIKN